MEVKFDLETELSELEKSLPEEAKDLTIDSVLSNFADHTMTGRVLEVCFDLDLQFDLTPYGFEDYTVSKNSYGTNEAFNVAERLRKLRRANAILKAKNSGILTFRTTDGLFSATAKKNESGEVLLRVFESETAIHMASIFIGKLVILSDESYEPQTVIIRYTGDFIGKSGEFYEANEQLGRCAQILKVNFTSFDLPKDPDLTEYLNCFSSSIDLQEISSCEIHPCDLSINSRDLVGGMSIGFHPERVKTIISEENPIGTAKKKYGALQ
jgi:hypothetical protein